MKEATGELNMTVIAIVAIAAIGAFFYAVIWPNIKTSIDNSRKCSSAVCGSCTTKNNVKTCTNCYINGKLESGLTCVTKES